MDKSQHWERIYSTKSAEQMSWHAPHLATSLEWISQAAPNLHASIIDVGGGASTLADDLLASGFDNLAIADISGTAIEHSRSRLGSASANINLIVGDITSVSLPHRAFDIWHDRAVFHFLVHPRDRSDYRKQLAHALKPDGQLILAVFSTNAPQTAAGFPSLATTSNPSSRSSPHTSACSRAQSFRIKPQAAPFRNFYIAVSGAPPPDILESRP